VLVVGTLFGIPGRAGAQLLCSCGHPCDVVIDNAVLSGSETIEACLTITAGDNVSIEPPATVVLRAGQSVSLGPSFYVTADPLVTFAVQIDEALFCQEGLDGDMDTWDDCGDCDDGDPFVNPDATEVCNGADDDCDGDIDEGVLDTNPACGPGATNLGDLPGDVAGPPLPGVEGTGERWLTFTLAEDSDTNRDLTATIVLTSPAGVDYDLFVYCDDCGTLAGSSSLGAGQTDTVHVQVDDPFIGGGDNSVELLVEVRYIGGASCSPWSLGIDGDTGPGSLPGPNCQ
jgi:hypothetical protein